MANKTPRSIVLQLRSPYRHGALDDGAVLDNPLSLFEQWLSEALHHNLPEPHAMTLATVSRHGKPRARIVLMRDFSSRGIVFFTNYRSAKAIELANRSYGAVVFYWAEHHRQVRIEGRINKVPRAESVAYFAGRPRGHQLSAHASEQGKVIASRLALEEKLMLLKRRFRGKQIPCPRHWGGYILKPELYEFWQGRENRLHDRIRYIRAAQKKGKRAKWQVERLAP